MSFTYFKYLPPEIRILIIKECDLETVMSYFKTARWARGELWENEWFWELKTRRDFGEMMEISFVDAIAIKRYLIPDFPVVWTKGRYTTYKPSTSLPVPEGWEVVDGWRLNYFYYRSKTGIEFIKHARDNDIDEVIKYLKAGIDPNSAISSRYVPHHRRGCTALLEASDKGNIGIVKILLKAGADPNIRCDYEWNPLLVACQECHSGIVALLLKAGADPNFRSGMKDTALMKASDQGNLIIVNKLLRARANPHIGNGEGHTALMYASVRGKVGIVKRLLEYGVDPHVVNNFGETALNIARSNDRTGLAKRRKYEEVIDILKEW